MPACQERAGSPAPGSTMPSTLCATAPMTPWRSPPSARTGLQARRPGRSCAARSPRWPSGFATLVAFLAAASVGAIWSACAQDYGADGVAARFAQLEPVSSGTTRPPKGIVHGHGGVLLEHCKLLGLHLDAGPDSPLLWYTTTNWMMWNIVASGLLVGAPVVLYDGNPTYPDAQRLWQISADHQVATLGVSPGYLLASAKAGLAPGRDLDLGRLRTLGSTGAPLTAPLYQWVHDAVGPRVQVASTTCGTDVVGGFAGSAPTTDVWAGEISAPNRPPGQRGHLRRRR
jgi:acyl-coenzyme A synthetase/AMP-(fatty) acid ligase